VIGDTWSDEKFGRTIESRREAIRRLPSMQVPGAASPAPAEAAQATPSSRPAQETTDKGNGNRQDVTAHQGWAQFLLSETNALVDVYAAARRRASEAHGASVTAEDVRCLMMTAFIQRRNGGPHVA
jgi:hypothetical protein